VSLSFRTVFGISVPQIKDTFKYDDALKVCMEETLHRFNPWWNEAYQTPGVLRETYVARLLSLKETRDIVLVTGLRRVGKTTLIYQVISALINSKSVEPERVFYVSLDNLALKQHTIAEIVDEYRRAQSIKHNELVYLFLDEVQSRTNYELELKNLYDMGYSKIYASGSGSLEISMRSPYLTGRQRVIHVSPLNFTEYLMFKGLQDSPADAHLYPALTEEYALNGGIPEYVKTGDINYIQALLDTIIYRDIAGVHGIRNPERIGDVLTLIAQSVGSPLSIRKISRVLGISKDEVSRLVSLFVEANLIYLVEKDGKVSERKAAPKKIYLSDTGFFAALTENINKGALMENLAYLTLRNSGTVRYQRIGGKEVDFVIKNRAWESKYRDNITEDDIKNLLTLKGVKDRTVITRNRTGEMEGVKMKPLWKIIREQNEKV